MSAPLSFWLHEKPLVLASKSQIRHQILNQLAIPHLLAKADIDERRAEIAVSCSEVALHLARAKALAVAPFWPGHLVLGADQTLLFEGQLLHKAGSFEEALDQLLSLSGKLHELHSGVAVIKHQEVVFENVQISRLKMRKISKIFVEKYIKILGETIFSTVGNYEIEALGPHLFEAIDGDHFAVLGLPIWPLLQYFRNSGYLQ